MRNQFSHFPQLLRRCAICLLPGLLFAFLAVLIAIRLTMLQQYYLLLEALLIAVVLGIVLHYAGARYLFSKLPGHYLLIFSFVLLSAIGAQLAGAPKLTYPLGTWDMYTSPEPFPLEYYEFVYVQESGNKAELFKSLYPIRARTFSQKFVDLYLSESSEEDGAGKLESDSGSLFRQALAAVANLHPANTESDPLTRIALYHYDLSLSVAKPEKELLIEVDLGR